MVKNYISWKIVAIRTFREVFLISGAVILGATIKREPSVWLGISLIIVAVVMDLFSNAKEPKHS
ncbi:MAG: hypothetical protein PHD81_04250 [Candidatus Nanoarchaeia archaeon]|nr:hypothetical protein [Candidatus Nanoarchaeia archaeon]MDD5588293.1 hypothetical protein [Candidatus Nanoarchaeia archaeon]